MYKRIKTSDAEASFLFNKKKNIYTISSIIYYSLVSLLITRGNLVSILDV